VILIALSHTYLGCKDLLPALGISLENKQL
jgi:hypothetical protein